MIFRTWPSKAVWRFQLVPVLVSVHDACDVMGHNVIRIAVRARVIMLDFMRCMF